MTTMEMIENHNNKFGFKQYDYECEKKSHYIISVTGCKGCYYTLYFFSKPIAEFGMCNPYVYRYNLSQDFDEAVAKFLEKGYNLPVECLDEVELTNRIHRYNEETFKSGKYRGKTIEEVYNTDPEYLIWYLKFLDDESQNKKCMYGHEYYLTKEQEKKYNILVKYVETYHEEQIALRRETIASAYENEGTLRNVTFEVTKAETKTNQFGETYNVLRGKNNDKYYILYPKGIDMDGIMGKVIVIKSAHCTNKEIYGVKYNYLSYIKGLVVA